MRHDLEGRHIFLRLGTVVSEQGNLLGSECTLIQRPVEGVTHGNSSQYAEQDGDEEVDRLGRLEHDDAQRVSKASVPCQHA